LKKAMQASLPASRGPSGFLDLAMIVVEAVIMVIAVEPVEPIPASEAVEPVMVVVVHANVDRIAVATLH
jgi:hypothetical protein